MFPRFLLHHILVLGVSASPKHPEWHSYPFHPPGHPVSAKAAYVMSNEPSGNNIVAMAIASDGTLSEGRSYSTNGNGTNLLNAVTGQPNFPDALASQDSIVRAGEHLFAVNAGSNSVSMFRINNIDPTKLELIGEGQDSKGVLPNTLAASEELKTVCVANTGTPAGIACATYSEDGLSAFDDLRTLDVGQSMNPATGPTPGFADLFFSDNLSTLVASVKGNGTEFTGYMAKFAVEEGKVATVAEKATPPGSGALFGVTIIPGTDNKIFASDASLGGFILDLDNLAGQPIATINVTNQRASCWAKISRFTGTGFLTDVLVNRLVEVSLEDGTILDEYYPPNPFQGMADFAVAGTKLWALSAGNGTFPASITTFDVSGGPKSARQVSVFAIPGAGVNSMGMVVG